TRAARSASERSARPGSNADLPAPARLRRSSGRVAYVHMRMYVTVLTGDDGWRSTMRLPNTEHTARPWRIHELTRDFRLEDVWALPTPGGPDDFPRLVQRFASTDPSQGSSGA